MLIDSYSKSNKRSRAGLTCAFAFIAAVASFNWLVDPHLALLKAVERTSSCTETHAKKTRMITSLTQLKKIEVDKLSAKMTEAQKQFFTFDTGQIFFTNIESLASQSSCTISSLKLLSNTGEPESKPADVNSIGISHHVASLSVVGSYQSIINFLSALANQPQKITIDGLMLSVPPDKHGRVECAMRVGIYVIDEKGVPSHE